MGGGGVWCHFPGLTHEHYNFQSKRSRHSIHMHIYFFLGPNPTLIQRGRGGGILPMPIHFPMGPRSTLAQKEGGGGGGGGVWCHFPGLTHEHYNFQSKRSRHSIHMHIYFFLGPNPTLIQRGRGGGILPMPIHFPMGPRSTLAQKGGGGGACA